jgi:nitroimidazol reductase NimA-like FMN-containing flavoprotein (pyridoxamine 5'-phosphate oxidase superfamily)
VARSIRLSSDEAWEMLRRAHTGVFTSLRGNGVPISLPVWFVTLDRRLYISGLSHTKKFARIRRDPRVGFLVESGERWIDLRGVHLTGTARIIDDADLLERVARALADKYDDFRTPRDQMPDATRTHYETAVTTIEITPDERILSWENARLFATD